MNKLKTYKGIQAILIVAILVIVILIAIKYGVIYKNSVEAEKIISDIYIKYGDNKDINLPIETTYKGHKVVRNNRNSKN